MRTFINFPEIKSSSAPQVIKYITKEAFKVFFVTLPLTIERTLTASLASLIMVRPSLLVQTLPKL